jgi:hypothetical protein
MACSSCPQTNCSCTNCTGCKYTINTDCVIYDGAVLSIEPNTTVPNSSRTLTTILEYIENCCNRPSVIETDDFTVDDTHVDKQILLKATFEDVSGGTETFVITLPDDAAYEGITLYFKDISGTGTGGRTATWEFASSIQYQWSPATLSSVDYATLADATHKVLRLTFVKISTTSYAWLVV